MAKKVTRKKVSRKKAATNKTDNSRKPVKKVTRADARAAIFASIQDFANRLYSEEDPVKIANRTAGLEALTAALEIIDKGD